MALDFKSESEVQEFIRNLGIEYRFGCYSEKKPEVCHLLGDYLEAVQKDYVKACRLFKATCDDYGYAKSCYKFGAYAVLGKGLASEDFPTALAYFSKACERGGVEGCFHQAMLLLTDNHAKGVPRDVPKAITLLHKACEGKHANACNHLSGLYIAGMRRPIASTATAAPSDKFLVTPDMRLAHAYALKGCELRNIYSCANLSQMYARGAGVAQNQQLADKYKKIALEIQEELDTNQTLTFQEGL